MNKDAAEGLALQALGWMAASDEVMGAFMGASGISIDDIRAQAKDPAFLGSVLDFLLMDDAYVTGFCDENGIDYQRPMIARQMLPGGDLPHWT